MQILLSRRRLYSISFQMLISFQSKHKRTSHMSIKTALGFFTLSTATAAMLFIQATELFVLVSNLALSMLGPFAIFGGTPSVRT